MADEEELTEEQIARNKKKLLRPDRKIVVKICDMDEETKENAIEYAQQGLR